MAARTRPPFRADHVGSLLRPQSLHQARTEHAAGKLDAQALAEVENEAILQTIQLQNDVGLQTVTDGELRRASWLTDFVLALGGIDEANGDGLPLVFKNAQEALDMPVPAMKVTDKIALQEAIFADDFKFLVDNAPDGMTPKLTIPGPSMVHYRGGDQMVDPAIYPEVASFWDDLVKAYSDEIDAVYKLGCRYLQLDDISLAYVNDPAQHDHIRAIGGDPAHLHELYIEQINRATAGRPDDLILTTHLCRGNNRSMWAAAGSYDFVAEALFSDLDVDGYFLEFDDERSGGFEPLRFVPKGKSVVLGLVTTKRAELESKDELKRRIDEAAKFCDLDQLCLSPQCGFSSTEVGNDLTIDEQKAKLQLVVEVAAEVWS